MVTISFFMTNPKPVSLIHVFLNTGYFKMELFLTKVNNVQLLIVLKRSSIFNVRYFKKDQWEVALIS